MSTLTTPTGGKRPTSGSTDTPTRDKRLKTIACDRCRRRKVKCDGDGYNHTPCKYCVSVGLQCTYGQKTGRTSTTSKTNPTPSRQTSRSKSSPTVINNVDNVAVTSGTLTASTSRQRKQSSHVISHQNNKQNTKKSSQISSNFNTITNSNRITRIVPQVLPTPDTKQNDFEYTVKLFTSMTLQDENKVRQRLKPYVQQISQVEESSPPRSQTSHALLEDSNLTGHLVDLYFKNFHPLLPVLHKAYFMERYHDKHKSISRLLLCAVCAIGSSYTNNPAARNNQHAVGMTFYQCAQEMVNSYFDLARLSTATALFLLGVFDALRSLKSRIYVGMATTLAITMRLHDKNAFPESLSDNEREARKRLWWGISITNHLNCITLNRMLALQDNHCNIEFPIENCEDDKENKIIIYFKHYLKITKITYDVLEFNLSDNCEPDNILHLEEQLNMWKKNLPPFLDIEGAKGLTTTYNETTTEHLRIYLCILYNYAIIRIHHPNISSQQSLTACTKAANNITSFVNEHFVSMVNSKQFIVHCALYAGFIHIINLNDPQHSDNSKRSIVSTIRLFQNVLNMPSLYYTHYSIKNLIAIFASQLEGTPNVDGQVMEFVRSSLVMVSGNAGNSSSNPVSPTVQLSSSPEGSRNNNNNHNHSNNVSNIVQDNSPMSLNLGLKKFSPIQQSAQNSPPGINLLAHTAATRSPHYIPHSPINHGPSGLQTQQQTTQSIFTTSPAPIDPPVTSAKIDSTNTPLISDVNYSPTNYINQHSNQTRQHDNTYNNYQWTTQQSSHLQPIQTQSHQSVQQQQITMSPTGNETMMVINNSPVSTSSSLRTISMTSQNSSSLPPLFATTNTNTHTAFTSSQMQFPYNTALPSMTYPQFSASQQQQPQHSSQPRQYYLASNSTSPPSTIGLGGNFVTGNDLSTGLAPMTGMLGNSGGVTNGILSASENSSSMLIDNQEHSGELDAQQHHHHHHQHHPQHRRSYGFDHIV